MWSHSGHPFHRRRLRDACNPWNLASVACTAGSRETLECNSTRYVAHASNNEIAIEGLWTKIRHTRITWKNQKQVQCVWQYVTLPFNRPYALGNFKGGPFDFFREGRLQREGWFSRRRPLMEKEIRARLITCYMKQTISWKGYKTLVLVQNQQHPLKVQTAHTELLGLLMNP